VVVKNRAGRVVPSQIISAERDADGKLIVANVAFRAEEVPAVGYDTYYLDFTSEPAAAEGALRFDQSALTLENEYLRVRLDPRHGGIVSLFDKRTGREALDGAKAPFPALSGKPNPNISTRPNPPAKYESATSKARIDWIEKGPVQATVRAYHDYDEKTQPQWKYLRFETRISLAAGQPYVEVVSRIMAKVPPQSDVHPADIKEGYWFSLAPSFRPTRILRDFPLAVEPTQNKEFHALTFVDLLGENLGLLVLHTGTQWFRKDDRGILQNLVMREWESSFTQEFGWPIYSEYRHALWPHGGNLTNADRLRAAGAFSQSLLARVGKPNIGDLPATKGFVTLSPPAVQLSALRRKLGGGLEIRVVEVDGGKTAANVEVALPVTAAMETNLLGAKLADVAFDDNRLRFPIAPWKIRTFDLKS
jgi:alpha-mannosidase